MALENQRRTQSQGASANFSRAVGEFRDSMHLLALQGKGRVQKWSPQVLPTPQKWPTSSFLSSRLFIIIKWISFVYRFWCFSNCCSRTRPQGNWVYVQPLSEQSLSTLQSFVSSRHIPHCIQSQMFWRFASTEVPSVEVPNVGHQPLISQVNAPDFWVPYQSCITTLGMRLLARQYLCLSCLSWCGPYSLSWRSCSASFQNFFRGKWSICSCRFSKCMGRSELSIFLYCYLGSPTHLHCCCVFFIHWKFDHYLINKF